MELYKLQNFFEMNFFKIGEIERIDVLIYVIKCTMFYKTLFSNNTVCLKICIQCLTLNFKSFLVCC